MDERGRRTIAIADIHGHSDALATLVRLINLQPEDTLVTLGDYIDLGPDSKGVLNQLIELAGRCRLVPLKGNHEEMMLKARESQDDFKLWMTFGGDFALESYGLDQSLRLVPRRHWAFLECLPLAFETERHFFLHANYDPNRPINEQDSETALWRPLQKDDLPRRHYSGKTAVLGHTPQNDGTILDLGHLVCLDTGCGHGGLLTALDVDSGRTWQVDEFGFAVLS